MKDLTKFILLFTLLISSKIWATDFSLENYGLLLDPSKQILLAAGKNPIMDQRPLGDPTLPPEDKAKPVTEAIPIWGKQAREKGYNLPFPFGTGLTYIFMKQGIEFSDVMVTIDGESEEFSGVTFEDPKRRDNIGLFKADMWLFPFLNLYGLVGYLGGKITTGVNISPDMMPDGVAKKVEADIKYDGMSYGLGLDFAGGYESLFVVIDSNFTWSNVDMVDTAIKTFTFSPKIGLLIEDKDLYGRGTVWVGAMYLNFDMKVSGSIATSLIDPDLVEDFGETLGYSAQIRPVGKWNMIVGGSWEVTPHWFFLLEAGFIKRTQFIFSPVYRF